MVGAALADWVLPTNKTPDVSAITDTVEISRRTVRFFSDIVFPPSLLISGR